MLLGAVIVVIGEQTLGLKAGRLMKERGLNKFRRCIMKVCVLSLENFKVYRVSLLKQFN